MKTSKKIMDAKRADQSLRYQYMSWKRLSVPMLKSFVTRALAGDRETASPNALALLFPDAGMHRFGTCQISLMVTKCLVSVI